jgi:hypothetical protein
VKKNNDTGQSDVPYFDLLFRQCFRIGAIKQGIIRKKRMSALRLAVPVCRDMHSRFCIKICIKISSAAIGLILARLSVH